MKIPDHVKESEAWKLLPHKRRCRYGAALNGLTTGMIFSFNSALTAPTWAQSYKDPYRDVLLVDIAIRSGELMLLCRNLHTGNPMELSWSYFKNEKITVHTRP